ncbi:hypothetical protein [Occultella kanbiaonis]|uniref:hypothetical protein n=1 Tax=Occultella kanbiaonis TaxID=2675754 RepID=UPI0012B96603|nr:hypothetical protein [Occultella kanbiaonis]
MRLDWGRGNVIRLDGAEVAQIPISPWSRTSKASIGGRPWKLRRGNDYQATPDGAAEPTFSVQRERGSSTSWHACSGSGWYGLRKEGTLSVGLTLWRAGAQVGHTGYTGGFPNYVRLDCEPSIPVDDAVLLLWFWYVLAASSQ